MCLAQEHNTVTPVRFQHAPPRSRVKHSSTVRPYTIMNMKLRGEVEREEFLFGRKVAVFKETDYNTIMDALQRV